MQQETAEWDRIERLTRRVGRFIPAFLVAWFLVLLVLGAVLGVSAPVFVLGTALAGLLAWRIERRWTAYRDRDSGASAAAPDRRRKPLGPVPALAIGAGVMLLIVYVIWVAATAS